MMVLMQISSSAPPIPRQILYFDFRCLCLGLFLIIEPRTYSSQYFKCLLTLKFLGHFHYYHIIIYIIIFKLIFKNLWLDNYDSTEDSYWYNHLWSSSQTLVCMSVTWMLVKNADSTGLRKGQENCIFNKHSINMITWSHSEK